MAGQSFERETFVVKIMNTQNDTWQGTVTWTDGRKSENFRSALELMNLIGSVLDAKDDTLLEQEL